MLRLEPNMLQNIFTGSRTRDIVICDRFVDSSIVYQGMARELGEEMVATINQYATKGLQPDITFS